MEPEQGSAAPETEADLRGTPTGGLVQQAVERGSRLVAAEIRLAKQEIAESLRAAVVALAGAGVALVATVAFVVMVIVTVVTAVQPHWLAALAFAVLFLVIAAASVVMALSRLKRISPLRQTADTIKEDVQWAKQQLTRDAR